MRNNRFNLEAIRNNYFIVPDKNESFKCPRCGNNQGYDSKDGFIQHSNAFGGSWKGDDIINKRCKKCDAVMDRYVNTDYLNFIKRWKNIGFIIALPFFVWGLNKFLDYLLA